MSLPKSASPLDVIIQILRVLDVDKCVDLSGPDAAESLPIAEKVLAEYRAAIIEELASAWASKVSWSRTSTPIDRVDPKVPQIGAIELAIAAQPITIRIDPDASRALWKNMTRIVTFDGLPYIPARIVFEKFEEAWTRFASKLVDVNLTEGDFEQFTKAMKEFSQDFEKALVEVAK